jgi:hypothetical protein
MIPLTRAAPVGATTVRDQDEKAAWKLMQSANGVQKPPRDQRRVELLHPIR